MSEKDGTKLVLLVDEVKQIRKVGINLRWKTIYQQVISCKCAKIFRKVVLGL